MGMNNSNCTKERQKYREMTDMVNDGMMQIIGKVKENLAHLAVLLVRILQTLIFYRTTDLSNRLLNQIDWLNQTLLSWAKYEHSIAIKVRAGQSFGK